MYLDGLGASAPYPFRPTQDYTTYQFQNSAYQNRQYFNSEQAKSVAALSPTKKPLQIISGNESDSSTNRKFRLAPPNGRKGGKFNNKRAYVLDETDENTASAEDFHQDEFNKSCFVNYDLLRIVLGYNIDRSTKSVSRLALTHQLEENF